MKIKNIMRVLAVGAMMGATSSCADYLDVSKELSQTLDKDEVFSNWEYLKKWYGEIYQTMPNYSQTGYSIYTTGGGFLNSWAILSGELVCAHPNVLQYGQNTFTPSSTTFNRWWNCYKQIRQGMIFLERAPDSMGDPSDRENYQSPSMMRRMKADVTYLIAYNYFLMFELYGPTPIIPEVADPSDENIDYARASVKEMVEHIDGLLEKVISGEYSDALPETYLMPNMDDNYDAYTNMLRPTKIAAMALRARLWVYAASPLFNGGYQEALQLVDSEGKRLFEDADAERWKTAKLHLEELLQFADEHGMGLYEHENEDGTTDPHLSVYELFQKITKETIWATPNGDYYGISGSMEARTAPWALSYAATIGGNVGPYQEMVDMFFTKNGLDIHEDPEYSEEGFTDWENPCTNTTISKNVTKKHVDKQIFNMYVNREPRFYAGVTYEGKSWHIQPKSYPDFGAYFSVASASSYKAVDTNARSGYLLYKFNNRTIMKGDNNKTTYYRPWTYFRLADFYLYYAEVCNEIDPGNPDIISYLDKVRERAGIPGYRTLHDEGVKTDVIGDQEAQREAIYRERIVEMFGEGNYYFDMHRWMRAGWSKDGIDGTMIKDNEDKSLIRTGMDINQITVTEFKESSHKQAKTFRGEYGSGTFYNRTVLDNYPWKKAMLLYPVPYAEMQKSKLVVQNPLWD